MYRRRAKLGFSDLSQKSSSRLCGWTLPATLSAPLKSTEAAKVALRALRQPRRALAPRLRLAPALVPFETALPPGLPRVLLLNSISLTPGTLSADIRDDTVWVHVLDGAGGHEAALAGLEARLARVFCA